MALPQARVAAAAEEEGMVAEGSVGAVLEVVERVVAAAGVGVMVAAAMEVLVEEATEQERLGLHKLAPVGGRH